MVRDEGRAFQKQETLKMKAQRKENKEHPQGQSTVQQGWNVGQNREVMGDETEKGNRL